NPLTDNNGNYTVTNVTSNGGKIQVTVSNTNGGVITGTEACVASVTGTTEANGCWVVSAQSGNNLTLGPTSVFVNAYTGGGSVTKFIPQGGSIAVSTSLNMIMVGGSQDYPVCTQDGGLTWTELRVPTGIAA